MRVYDEMFMQVIPIVIFCFLVWWVHQSSQWRVGRPATWGGTVRFGCLNVILLAVFVLGFIAVLTSFNRYSASAFLEVAFPSFIAFAVAPVTIGSVILAFSGHASFRHSFIGMTLGYIGVIVIIGSEIVKSAFIGYATQDMGWEGIDFSFLFSAAFSPLAFLYFLLFTTGGYVISEWLESKYG